MIYKGATAARSRSRLKVNSPGRWHATALSALAMAPSCGSCLAISCACSHRKKISVRTRLTNTSSSTVSARRVAFIRMAKASIRRGIEWLQSIFAASKMLTLHPFRYRTSTVARCECSDVRCPAGDAVDCCRFSKLSCPARAVAVVWVNHRAYQEIDELEGL